VLAKLRQDSTDVKDSSRRVAAYVLLVQQLVRLILVVITHACGLLILSKFEVLLLLGGLVDESFFKVSQCFL